MTNDIDIPRGRDANLYDRLAAAAIIFIIIVAAFSFTPAAPYPLALQRHAAAVAASGLFVVVAATAALGRGFPVPPVPAGILAIAGAGALSVVFCKYLMIGHSPERAGAVAASLAGLVVAAAAARSCARAHLGKTLLISICTVGFVIIAIGLLEFGGFDPLGTAGYYNSKMSPVATFGNADAAVDFAAPIAAVAAALACSVGGTSRIVLLLIASAGGAYLGALGVLFGIGALAAGLATGLFFSIRRVRAGTDPGRRWLAPILINITIPAAAFLIFFMMSPNEAPASAPAPRAIITETNRSHLPASLEIRLRIWISCINVFRTFAPWGTAAGNFSIGFAPFRDPVEIDLSTRFRGDPVESVVDAAHNDPIQFVTEMGALGILAIGAFAVGFVKLLKRGAASASPNTVAAAAGLASLFVCSLFHSPFYEHAGAAVVGFVLLGILGAADGRAPEKIGGATGRMLGIVLLLCAPYAAVLAGCAFAADIYIIGERLHPLAGTERLEQALKLNTTDEHIPLLIARKLQISGDPNGALSAYAEARRRHPFLVESLLQSGVLYAKSGNYQNASDAFSVCARLDPRHPALTYNRACLARDMGDDTGAAKLIKESVKFGAAADTLRQWGVAFYENKQYQRARPYLDLWVADRGDDADAWSMLGTASLKLNNRASAEVELARAHRLYSLEHLRSGNLDAAQRSARQYHNWAGPGDAGPDLIDAAVAFANKDRDGAKQAFARASAVNSKLQKIELDAPALKELLKDAELGALARALVHE